MFPIFVPPEAKRAPVRITELGNGVGVAAVEPDEGFDCHPALFFAEHAMSSLSRSGPRFLPQSLLLTTWLTQTTNLAWDPPSYRDLARRWAERRRLASRGASSSSPYASPSFACNRKPPGRDGSANRKAAEVERRSSWLKHNHTSGEDCRSPSRSPIILPAPATGKRKKTTGRTSRQSAA